MATLDADSQQHAIMAAITVLIVTLEYLTRRGALSNFAARKLCHAGCGLGIFMLDSHYLPGA